MFYTFNLNGTFAKLFT